MIRPPEFIDWLHLHGISMTTFREALRRLEQLPVEERRRLLDGGIKNNVAPEGKDPDHWD